MPEGDPIPLHLMDTRYTPDMPNPRAERIKERIARKSRTGRAILAYAVPAFWSPGRGASHRGIMLGGSLLDGGAWRDFALTTAPYGGNGIADVLSQPPLPAGAPDEDFFERYAFEKCPHLAVFVAGDVAGIPRNEVVGDFLGTLAGWAVVSARRVDDPMPREVARLVNR